MCLFLVELELLQITGSQCGSRVNRTLEKVRNVSIINYLIHCCFTLKKYFDLVYIFTLLADF